MSLTVLEVFGVFLFERLNGRTLMFSSNRSGALDHVVLTFPERVCVTVVRAALQHGPLINFTTLWGKKQMPPVVLTINAVFTDNRSLVRI